MKKPSKTAAELEAAIKLEMEDICNWPADVATAVRPDADKIVFLQDAPYDAEGMTYHFTMISVRFNATSAPAR
jgi:hypothetical protein